MLSQRSMESRNPNHNHKQSKGFTAIDKAPRELIKKGDPMFRRTRRLSERFLNSSNLERPRRIIRLDYSADATDTFSQLNAFRGNRGDSSKDARRIAYESAVDALDSTGALADCWERRALYKFEELVDCTVELSRLARQNASQKSRQVSRSLERTL